MEMPHQLQDRLPRDGGQQPHHRAGPHLHHLLPREVLLQHKAARDAKHLRWGAPRWRMRSSESNILPNPHQSFVERCTVTTLWCTIVFDPHPCRNRKYDVYLGRVQIKKRTPHGSPNSLHTDLALFLDPLTQLNGTGSYHDITNNYVLN